MESLQLVAEVGQAHEGSLGILHSYIDALSCSGVDTIKFQTHIAFSESSIHEKFRKHFSYVDKSRFDYWKRMEFTRSQWLEIKKHCEDVGLEFLSTPFCVDAAKLLEGIGVNRFKVGSGDLENFLLLDYLASTGKELIISTGIHDIRTIDEAVNFLSKRNSRFSILQCTSDYPVPPEKWGLNMIEFYRERYGVRVGYSDHSGEIFAGLSATAMGAELLEFHVTFDKRMFGPDTSSSLTLDEINMLVKGCRSIRIALNNPLDKNHAADSQKVNRNLFGKSLSASRFIPSGKVIVFDDLESRKPGDMGIPAKNFNSIIGKKTLRDINEGDFLNNDDYE